MYPKTLSTASALCAAVMLPGLAAANVSYNPDPAVVTINVVVQPVAVLSVVDGTASMTIDDPSDTYMGQPSSGGSSFDAADSAVLRLETNVDVDSINFTYPKVNTIQNFDSDTWFGRAIGQNTSRVLGVWPQAGVLDSPTGSVIGGGGGMVTNDDSSETAPLVRPNAGGGAFGVGVHYIAAGVSTNWDRVPDGEGFAVPDTYAITLTATIVLAP